jgi:hypothetical protein
MNGKASIPVDYKMFRHVQALAPATVVDIPLGHWRYYAILAGGPGVGVILNNTWRIDSKDAVMLRPNFMGVALGDFQPYVIEVDPAATFDNFILTYATAGWFTVLCSNNLAFLKMVI